MSQTDQAGAFRVRQMRAEEADLCEGILRSLPGWFGIEESIVEYRRDLDRMETFVAEVEANLIGFLALNQHNEYTAEIHVFAVKEESHRRGIGRALVKHAEELLQSRGVEFLEVKTLGPSKPYEKYERTRAFYMAMGFRPLEETNLWWGEENPCLIMIKHLVCEQPAN